MYGIEFLGSNTINIFIYLKKLGCVFSKHVLHPELKVFMKRIRIANSIAYVINVRFNVQFIVNCQLIASKFDMLTRTVKCLMS